MGTISYLLEWVKLLAFPELSHHVNSAFLERNLPILFILPVIYLLVTFGLEQLMKNRKPFKLKLPLIAWNFAMSAGSFWYGVQIWYCIYRLESKRSSLHEVLCSGSWKYDDRTVALGLLFTLSKFLEYIDTMFLVLRKKKVIVLHWFHHFSVIFPVWYSLMEYTAMSPTIGAINASIHFFMYAYYGARALGMKIPTFVPITITTMQIIQMVFGVSVSAFFGLMYISGSKCNVNGSLIFIGGAIGTAYFFLFCDYFRKAYLTKKGSRPPMFPDVYQTDVKSD